MKHTFRLSVGMALLFVAAGCTTFWQVLTGSAPRQGVSGSLVEFIYPDGEQPPAFDEVVPTLEIPLRVGLAFVPSQVQVSGGLPAATKAQLLEKVRLRFIEQDYIKDIQIIPETYLSGRKGFAALEQISRMYSLDVIALVSYDQLAIADDRTSSFLYWTIVGAYLVKGSENDVRTFVDTAVFDIKTRKLLLRAPGVNELTSTSTLINVPEAMREAREESFATAMTDMTVNLESELERFEERIKEDKSVLIAKRGGGAGSMGAELLIGLALIGALGLARKGRPLS